MAQTIADRYDVIETLGRGGMAIVYLAEDRVLGRRVAVKRMHAAETDMADRLVREARLGASLNHPNVVNVYDALSSDGEALIVMEYVAGETLGDALQRGPLPRERALEVLTGIADALDHVHEHGIVHRDIKPGNVLLGDDGAIKLADLGIALSAELTRLTAVGTALGSVPYMAPEQLGGDDVTPATDVYALAALAYEVLSGTRARRPGTPAEVMAQVANAPPPDLRAVVPDATPEAADVIRRGMAFEPSDRPASAGALVRELGEALSRPATEPAPPAARADRSVPRASPPPALTDTGERRRRMAPVLLMALGLAAALVVAVVLAAGGGDPSPDDRAAGTAEPQRTATSEPDSTAAPESTPAAEGGGPAQAVKDWYAAAARQDMDTVCARMGPQLEARFSCGDLEATFSTLRSVEFKQADVVEQSGSSATVRIQTVARHTDRTDNCTASVQTVKGDRGWLIDGLSVKC
jgi:tRNA A-37 threonylcarbamoyl transferase component Bud32